MQPSGYLANQLGFSETGRYVLDNLVKPRIERIGLRINDPFLECGKELDFGVLEGLQSYHERMAYWDAFNQKLPRINNDLMRNSDCLLAILDGGHTIDDGVASEIAFYASLRRGPVFALRSDFRLAENIAAYVNPQVTGYITESGGQLVAGPGSLERWFSAIESFKKEWDAKHLAVVGTQGAAFTILPSDGPRGKCNGSCGKRHKH